MWRFRGLAAVLLFVAISGCASQRYARNCSPCYPTYVCRPVYSVPCQPASCNYCPQPCNSCGSMPYMSSYGGVPLEASGGVPIEASGF